MIYSLHLARKYARIFVCGHYLFREANRFTGTLFTVQTKYERMWGPELAGLETLKAIQATMFKVTEDVSCCTEECMQALETLYFWWDMVWTFCALIQAKFEYQIQYCFEFLALNVTVKMSYETQCSTMKFINSPLEGMWLVQLNLDLTNLYMMKSSQYNKRFSWPQ